MCGYTFVPRQLKNCAPPKKESPAPSCDFILGPTKFDIGIHIHATILPLQSKLLYLEALQNSIEFFKWRHLDVRTV